MKYFRQALLKSWNLLALAGAGAAAWWTGDPTILYVAGGVEVAYLAFAANSSGFRTSVDLAEHAAERKRDARTAEQSLQRMLRELPQATLTRFRQLRQRCLDLEKLARPLSGSVDRGGSALAQFQAEGLDELLWVYLRLLYTQHALQKFADTTKPELIAGDVRRYREKLAELSEGVDEASVQQRTSLAESLRASEERLQNVTHAGTRLRGLQAELERIEMQLRATSEQMVARHDPESLARQATLVTESLRSTESSLNEFRELSGLTAAEAPPELLRNSTLTMK